MRWLHGVQSSLSSYTQSHNVDITFIDIPATTSQSATLAQNTRTEATVYRLNNSSAFIHARLTDSNTVLELRYLTWLEKNEHDKIYGSPRNMRLQIRASATLLPIIRFTHDSEALWCFVLSTNNYIVRIRIPVNTMFLTPLPANFYAIQQLDKHVVPVTFNVTSSNQVIIACENGSMIYLYDSYNGKRDKDPFSSHEIFQQDANTHKKLFAYLSSIPLLSSIFPEGVANHEQRSQQPTALAVQSVSKSGDSTAIVGAAICRDRRLRVWFSSHNHTVSQALTELPWFNQHNKLVQADVNLMRDTMPGSIGDAGSIMPHVHGSNEPELGPAPTKDLRLLRVSENLLLAIAFVESEKKPSFAVYQIALEDGDIRSLKLVSVVNYQPKGDEWLSGFDIALVGIDLTLWTVWQRRSLAVVRTATLSNVLCDDDSPIQNIATKVRWRTILPDSVGVRLNAEELDTKDIPQTFLKHIFTPGAFSDSNIRKALMMYVETVDAHVRTLTQDDYLTNNEDREMHEVTSIGNSSDDDRPTLKSYTCELIANHIVKEEGDEEGYQTAVNKEWKTFYCICCDFEDEEAIPLAILTPEQSVGDHISNPAIVARHDGFSTVRRLDELELLYHHYAPVKDDLQQECFVPMELENSVFDDEDVQTTKLLTNRKYNSNVIGFGTVMASLVSIISEEKMAEIDLWLEQTLFRDSSVPNADAIGHQLYNRYISKSNISASDEKLTMTQLRECGDLDATVHLILDTLIDTLESEISGDKTSDVLDSIITTATTQLVETRYYTSRNVMVVLAFLVALDGNQKIMKNTLDRLEECQSILKAYTLLRWMCRQSLDQEVGNHFGIEAAIAENSHQAHVATSQIELVHPSGLIQLLVSRYYPCYVHHERFEVAVTRSARQLIQQLKFLQSNGKFCESSVVSVANSIESLGQPKLALSILQCLPVSDAVLFVQAKCWTRLGETKDAENAFLRVANGFDDFYEHQPQTNVLQALQRILPQGCDTLIDYYIHVSAFVFAHAQADLIIRFGKLALTSIEAVHESKKAKESGHKRYIGSTGSLWYRVFVGYLLKKDVEGATAAMTSIEEMERRADAAKYLVSWLAENDNLGTICTLPLSGFRPQVEDALVAKAEAQDAPVPDSQVNFSKHLYAFYIYAGDYGPAALAMYKLAKRCQRNIKAPGALKQSITSYLAAINSLSMLPSDRQWLSVSFENDNDDMIDISRLRKEYVATKAHFDLMGHYPEVASAYSIISIQEAVDKFEKIGLHDRARVLKHDI